MSEKLTPTITVNDKTYEIKKTRSLLIEYNNGIEAIKNANENAEVQAERLLINVQKIEQDVKALSVKIEEARNAYFDDPTNAEKKAKFEALKVIESEYEETLLSNSEERKYVEKSQKQILDLYEKCIIFALSEQYNISTKEAKSIWSNFVDEIGKSNASLWVYEIGDSLFNVEEEDNSFLARKRAMKNKMDIARNQAMRK